MRAQHVFNECPCVGMSETGTLLFEAVPVLHSYKPILTIVDNEELLSSASFACFSFSPCGHVILTHTHHTIALPRTTSHLSLFLSLPTVFLSILAVLQHDDSATANMAN